MKYHTIPANHNIISIYTLPQKKEFIFKFQENENNRNTLRTIIIFRVH